jgi:hypothetical protein
MPGEAAVTGTAEDGQHTRPAGASDDLVAAVGKLSEALETIERARGQLYTFHQLSGHADRQVQEAVSALREAGATDEADRVEQTLVGRDVLRDMWTFEVVEAYDGQYWSVFREVEKYVRDALMSGRRHVFEAEMKRSEQGG